ncbi:hypothetical protein COMA2_80074 [Candidatus Nitrospira nitrificans]|uniref:Uncharacterized protein n=1 Tax=Candidatus Nitrospira nitrificans TaxID=1742973 RepID=A0A0S4LSK3_9BACT|nr:hypothetical protein COMA2_80074 [Candidatus Nitrospira nitrificans]
MNTLSHQRPTFMKDVVCAALKEITHLSEEANVPEADHAR